MTVQVPSLFNSFFMGGFECSTHRRQDGQRLDVIAGSHHDRWAVEDYSALRHHGIGTARDGLRWHLIEGADGHFDWSSFLPQLLAAERTGMQVIWDLGHYGWPDHIDVWRPQFVERFARFAGAAARVVREHSDRVPFYSPLNEISFSAWAGGEVAYFSPLGRGRGDELKHQLVRASIAAIEAIREVHPRARFVQTDPLIHVVPRSKRGAEHAQAERERQVQFQAWDMLAGLQWPGLGGKADYLDIVGVNYYSNNQWHLGGGTLWQGEPGYRPLSGMLAEVCRRYGRPVFVAETGAEGEKRVPWLRYVCEQVGLARQQGFAVEGVCLYPVLDYPGWTDDRHCETGLLGYADSVGQRPVFEPLAEELVRQQDQEHRG